MQNNLSGTTSNPTDKARHAYNNAFERLDLSWHWDEATYHRLQTDGHSPLRQYLETEQAHLLSAYEAEFLLKAIETALVSTPMAQGHAFARHKTPSSLPS
jgi:hypothetical protein